ncbi:hypothetical protein RE9431_24380 [Prescottella equi]|nr:hypothetical protein RE9431_24380 [Prescottella equi]BCN73832.1 hypothetical protein RE0327_24310 [Prescottella equi]
MTGTRSVPDWGERNPLISRTTHPYGVHTIASTCRYPVRVGTRQLTTARPGSAAVSCHDRIQPTTACSAPDRSGSFATRNSIDTLPDDSIQVTDCCRDFAGS